jgi:RNA polymerase sigma-70 factor, ECF subfamily
LTNRARAVIDLGMTADADDERALVAAWLAGDRQAGFHLFQRHYDAVARFFHHKVPEHSADLIQRTFLGCLEGLANFRGHASFRSYLFAIAYRQLCRHFRDHGRERARLDFASVSVEDLRPSPTAAIGAREDLRLLLAALRRIPLELQVTLELHYWERMTTGEIAEALEIPPGTARTRLMRARNLLRARMAEIAADPPLVESTMAALERWAADLRALRDEPDPEQ